MGIEQYRKCKKCEITKILSDFVNSKGCKLGKSWICLDCSHKKHKLYEKNNRESANKRCKKHRKLNRDTINERRKELRLNNIEEIRKKDREYYQANKDAEYLKQKKYRANNKEKIAESQKKYRLNNIEKIKDIKRKHRPRQNKLDRMRRKTDSKWKLNRTISNYIYQTLCGRKLGKHWETLVNFTLDDLRKHLEKQFVGGMTWENYGEWHIDHKIPIAAHNFTKPEHEDFKRCWALKNLQPMWALENILKGTKINKSFQPSLLM